MAGKVTDFKVFVITLSVILTLYGSQSHSIIILLILLSVRLIDVILPI